jgi:hypothetical protein
MNEGLLPSDDANQSEEKGAELSALHQLLAEDVSKNEPFQLIARSVQQEAIARKGDGLALLSLLRLLEALHRDIRETLFQDTLPTSRQDLYAFLRDIEASGGWPYIHRMKIRRLLEYLETTEDGTLKG